MHSWRECAIAQAGARRRPMPGNTRRPASRNTSRMPGRPASRTAGRSWGGRTGGGLESPPFRQRHLLVEHLREEATERQREVTEPKHAVRSCRPPV